MTAADNAEARFAALVEQLADRPGVTPPEPGARRFGASALKVGGSIFAMLQDGRLVVKLPGERVAELIAEGAGEPFGAGRGRPMTEPASESMSQRPPRSADRAKRGGAKRGGAMREWVAIPGGDDARWRALAEEALAFVGGS